MSHFLLFLIKTSHHATQRMAGCGDACGVVRGDQRPTSTFSQMALGLAETSCSKRGSLERCPHCRARGDEKGAAGSSGIPSPIRSKNARSLLLEWRSVWFSTTRSKLVRPLCSATARVLPRNFEVARSLFSPRTRRCSGCKIPQMPRHCG